jgi:hypothetical protein
MAFTLVLPLWRRRRGGHRPIAPAPEIKLLAGQRRDLSLAPGAGLRVAAGSLVLRRPARWLGETLRVPPELLLCEGDTWTSAEREHVTLVATSASRFILR